MHNTLSLSLKGSLLPSLLRWCLLLCCSVFVWLLTSPAQALSPAQRAKIRKQAQQLHKQGKYPSALPHNELAPPKAPPVSWLERLLRKLFGEGLKNSFKLGSKLGAILKYSILVMLVILVALLLWVLLRTLTEAGSTELDEGILEAEEGFMGFDFRDDMDAGEVAQEGRYDVAICLLLWKALRKTGWRPEGRGASQTGRELVYRMSPLTPGHSALLELLFLAERVRFGNLHADAAMFAEAQQEFQTFEAEYRPPQESQRIYSARKGVADVQEAAE